MLKHFSMYIFFFKSEKFKQITKCNLKKIEWKLQYHTVACVTSLPAGGNV